VFFFGAQLLPALSPGVVERVPGISAPPPAPRILLQHQLKHLQEFFPLIVGQGPDDLLLFAEPKAHRLDGSQAALMFERLTGRGDDRLPLVSFSSWMFPGQA